VDVEVCAKRGRGGRRCNDHACNRARSHNMTELGCIHAFTRQRSASTHLKENGNFGQLPLLVAQPQTAQVRSNRRHLHDYLKAAHASADAIARSL
jgi:hypothetical protein